MSTPWTDMGRPLPPPDSGLTVAIDDVVLDGSDLRDDPVDQAHVDVLAEILDDCPPIVLQACTRRLVDGRHRLEAARQLGRRHVHVDLLDVADEQVWAERVARNAGHGLPLTREERRRAAVRLLDQHPDWSDRRIGRCVGMAHTTIGRLRRDCPGGARNQLDTTTRLGGDGRTYPSPAQLQAAREMAQEMVTEDPDRSDRSIGRASGLSPTTVGKIRHEEAPAEGEVQGQPDPSGSGASSGISRVLQVLRVWWGQLTRVLRATMRRPHAKRRSRLPADSGVPRCPAPPPQTPPRSPEAEEFTSAGSPPRAARLME